jgi:hypothetical protein
MRWGLVDRILGYERWALLTALKLGTFEEYRLLERWGEGPRGPAALLMESAIQAARWLVEASTGFASSILIDELQGPAPRGLGPGEGIVWTVRTAGPSGGRASFTVLAARAFATGPDGPETPEGEGLIFSGPLTPLEELDEPERREALWRELTLGRSLTPPAGGGAPGAPMGPGGGPQAEPPR